MAQRGLGYTRGAGRGGRGNRGRGSAWNAGDFKFGGKRYRQDSPPVRIQEPFAEKERSIAQRHKFTSDPLYIHVIHTTPNFCRICAKPDFDDDDKPLNLSPPGSEYIRRAGCKHLFHAACYDKLLDKSECPTCGMQSLEIPINPQDEPRDDQRG